MRSEREGDGLPKSSNPIPVIARDEIAGRAYQLYLQRGSEDGYDVEDWLQAEQELAHEQAEQAPRPRVSKPEAA